MVLQMKAKDPDSNPDLVYFLAKTSNLDSTVTTNDIFQAFDENRNQINIDLVKVSLSN